MCGRLGMVEKVESVERVWREWGTDSERSPVRMVVALLMGLRGPSDADEVPSLNTVVKAVSEEFEEIETERLIRMVKSALVEKGGWDRKVRALRADWQALEGAFRTTSEVFKKFSNDLAERWVPEGTRRSVWMMYLIAKRSRRSREPLDEKVQDRASALHMLLACIVVWNRFRLRVTSGTHTEDEDEDDEVEEDILGGILEETGALREEIEASLHHVENGLPPKIAEMFKGQQLSTEEVVDTLEETYLEMIQVPNVFCFDERIFLGGRNIEMDANLDDEDSPLAKLAAVASSQEATPVRSSSKPKTWSGLRTPFSRSFAAVRWISQLTESRPEVDLDAPMPSETLSKFLVREDANNWEEVSKRAHDLSRKAFPDSADIFAVNFDNRTTRNCQRNSLALYFYALEGILEAEGKRIGTYNLDSLVCNERFQRSLIACAAEASCASFGRTQIVPFPGVLERLELPSFEMSKAIKSFLDHTRGLPRTAVRHLAFCQERILEGLAWSNGSPLVEMLSHRAQDAREPEASERARRSRETILRFFFDDLMVIASARTSELCSRLRFDGSAAKSVWETVKFVIADHWNLMFDRHLDQFILCSTYAVDKVRPRERGEPLKFKEIIEFYKSLPHVNTTSFAPILPCVYRDIPLDQSGSDRGDIIKFYNRVFVQDEAIKNYILSVSRGPGPSSSMCSSTGETPDKLKVQICSSPLRPPNSLKRVRLHSGSSITISPMTQSNPHLVDLASCATPVRFKTPRTNRDCSPGTRRLYAFDSPGGLAFQLRFPDSAATTTPSQAARKLVFPSESEMRSPRTTTISPAVPTGSILRHKYGNIVRPPTPSPTFSGKKA